MDEGGSHPCLDLGEADHRLLAWAGRNARPKDNLVRACGTKLEYRVEVEVGDATWSHLEDNGYVEKVTIEETYTYRVLVFCRCSGGNPRRPPTALRREPKVSRSDGLGEVLVVTVPARLSAVPSGVKSESVQKSVTTGYLAKVVFPRVVRGAGIEIMPENNYAGLINNLNRWKLRGIKIETIELMMEAFASHPEWCQRSRKPPWRIFVARMEELYSEVAHRARRDPANRRWSNDKNFFQQTAGTDKDYFGRRHTPLVNSPA